jgi:hypothetical protein
MDMQQEVIKEALWDATQATMAIKAVSEMMREYAEQKDWSSEVANHIDSGMWLCGALSDHQRNLIERMERVMNGLELEAEPIKRPTLSDALHAAR